ncbi:hypothetical protein ANN_14144 [Periplaneta americana]|uniref:Zinc finger PHD-type domain-containing protein n=1 Tax=Periplaneta americana TaxID=6978 RepID=A0ABQ8SVH5_PERAM|nr:hypothetical protein ANN_14144 [Periplaneta americana]
MYGKQTTYVVAKLCSKLSTVLLGVQFKVCHGSLYFVTWLVDEPREFNLPTLPQRCITYVKEKLPSKYGVHSEDEKPALGQNTVNEWSGSAGEHLVLAYKWGWKELKRSVLDDRTFMMPPVISRPSKGKWHPDSMKQAVEKVLTGQLSIRKAAEIYNIPQSDAFARVSRAEIALKGFQCTGIHPLNPNVFTELDYLPSMMTDIAMNSNVDQNESPTVRPMLPFPDVTSAPKASSHHETSPNRLTPTDRPNDTTVVKETIQQLSPIPDASKKREVSRRRKSERSEVLTSSPYKKYLEEKNNEKFKREVKSLVRGKRPLSGKFFPKSSRKTTKKNDEKEETTCIFCGESHDEDWIQCSSCQMWGHEACTSIPETSDTYECDFCQK